MFPLPVSFHTTLGPHSMAPGVLRIIVLRFVIAEGEILPKIGTTFLSSVRYTTATAIFVSFVLSYLWDRRLPLSGQTSPTSGQ